MQTLMPALFIGHGSPLNTIEENIFTQQWHQLAQRIPEPKAILCISAHWYTQNTKITVSPTPKTIHDFSGFPQALYDIQYPASGSPKLAQQVIELLAPSVEVLPDENWGLDHGAWSILYHLYPQANIPVVQLSINRNEPPEFHYKIGKQLAPLREQNILILGSGNIVHNLGLVNFNAPLNQATQWATLFEDQIKDFIEDDNIDGLLNYQHLGPIAQLSAPTPEHFLPLLYVMGSKHPNEKITYPVTGNQLETISMFSVAIGDSLN